LNSRGNLFEFLPLRSRGVHAQVLRHTLRPAYEGCSRTSNNVDFGQIAVRIPILGIFGRMIMVPELLHVSYFHSTFQSASFGPFVPKPHSPCNAPPHVLQLSQIDNILVRDFACQQPVIQLRQFSNAQSPPEASTFRSGSNCHDKLSLSLDGP